MAEWKERTLGDLGTIVGGGTPSRERTEYWHGPIRWLTPGELTGKNAKYVSETQSCITELGLSSSGARLLPQGSLLVTSRATIGSCALAGVPMATNQGFKNLIPSTEIDPSYLFYLGRTLGREMTRRATGTTFLEISGREFGHIKVRLPPWEEQRRIAEILDTIDETIQATERVIAKLVVVAHAIQHRLVSSGSGRSVRLASIAVLSGGHGFPEDEQGYQTGSLPFYKVSDMNRTGNEKFLDRANNYVQPETAQRNGWRVLPPGAVVFAKVGAALLSNRRRILRVPSIIDNNMMAAVPRELVSTEWLYRWLQTVDFAEFVQVGALPSVNQGLVGGLTLDLPTLREQERQTDVLYAFDSRINTELAQLAKWKRVRAGLAADLLSRRVRTVAA